MKKQARVVIIGIGNCASALIQGVEPFKQTKDDPQVPGLTHVNLGGYYARNN